MVGRGAQGRPWFPAQLRAALAGQPMPAAPTGADLVDLVAGHHDAMLSHYGRDVGLRAARKHLGWYVEAVRGSAALRHRLQFQGFLSLPLLAVAMAPHVIILAGNFAACVSAMRARAGGWMIAVFVAWIAASILCIMLLGVVSPNTFLIRVLL